MRDAAFKTRSTVIAAAIICALLSWTSGCVADGVRMPVRSSMGVASVHSGHAPNQPDACCQQIFKLLKPAGKAILPSTRLVPHADWSTGVTTSLALAQPVNRTFNTVASPGTSPPLYILRAWPNAPPLA